MSVNIPRLLTGLKSMDMRENDTTAAGQEESKGRFSLNLNTSQMRRFFMQIVTVQTGDYIQRRHERDSVASHKTPEATMNRLLDSYCMGLIASHLR